MDRAAFIAAAIQALGDGAEIASGPPASAQCAWEDLGFDHPNLREQDAVELIKLLDGVVLRGAPSPAWLQDPSLALVHVTQVLQAPGATAGTSATMHHLAHLQYLLALHDDCKDAVGQLSSLALRQLPLEAWQACVAPQHLGAIASSPPATATCFAVSLRAFVSTRTRDTVQQGVTVSLLGMLAAGGGPVDVGAAEEEHPWPSPSARAAWCGELLADTLASSSPSAATLSALLPALEACCPAAVTTVPMGGQAALSVLMPWVAAVDMPDTSIEAPLGTEDGWGSAMAGAGGVSSTRQAVMQAAVAGGLVRGVGALLPSLPASPPDDTSMAVLAASIRLLTSSTVAVGFLTPAADALAGWLATTPAPCERAAATLSCVLVHSTHSAAEALQAYTMTRLGDSVAAAFADVVACRPGGADDMPGLVSFASAIRAARTALQVLLGGTGGVLHAQQCGLACTGDAGAVLLALRRAQAVWRAKVAPALATVEPTTVSSGDGSAAETGAGGGDKAEPTPLQVQRDKCREGAAGVAGLLGRTFKVAKALSAPGSSKMD